MNNESIYRKRITWLRLIALSPILAFSPLIMFGLSGAGGWFMIMTIPAALVLSVIALIKFLEALQIKLSKAEEPTISEQKLKRYFFAWLATALSPIVLIVGLVIFGIGVSLTMVDGNFYDPGIGYQIAAIIGTSIYALSWLYLPALAIWHWVKK